MLCFELLGEPGTRVLLCDETIRYSAYKEDGVHLAATVVVCFEDCQNRFIYAIHPRFLGTPRVQSVGGQDEPGGIPYSFVFSNIAAGRFSSCSDGRSVLKLFRGEASVAKAESIEVCDAMVGTCPPQLQSEYPSEPATQEVTPFTSFKIGPFPGGEVPHIFRLEAHVSGSSFDDLIEEDEGTGTRLYKVYGAQYIHRQIESICIPQALTLSDSSALVEQARFFDTVHNDYRRLVPEEYSVVAIDNPNCNPARLRPLSLSADLMNVTNQIDPIVYDHVDLMKVRGRIHWFVTRHPTDTFLLQLLGPIAVGAVAV